MRLTHSTLSAQLRALEEHFDAPLFERRGKGLVLTAFGSDAAGYAADIFRLGRELNDAARGRRAVGRYALRVGVVSDVPKTLAHHLPGPAFDREEEVLFLRQDRAPALPEALAVGRLHLVLMNDVPTFLAEPKLHVHALGETDIYCFARARLA